MATRCGWRPQGGELLAEYEGHKHEEYSLDCCLTPSDAFVICGSEDGALLTAAEGFHGLYP